MRVKDLLGLAVRPPVTITGNKTIREAMRILVEHNIGSLIIVDNDGAPVGIITERDIFRLTYEHDGKIMDMNVTDHMTTKMLIGLPDDDVEYIAQVITQNRVRHIPIIDENNKLSGIVSIGDVVRAKLDLAEIHVRYLTEYITGRSHIDSE